MKKLDDKGFSLSAMITFVCIFIFFLIVVALISFNLGVGKDSPEPLYDIEEEGSK